VGFVRVEPSGRTFHCAPGQTILAGALAAGIDLPYECASGSCGSCRARMISGNVAILWPDAPGLSERDRSRGGRILCCQSVAQTECVIQVRPNVGVPSPAPATLMARVREIRLLNPDVMHITLQTQSGFDFRPGQFVLFELNSDVGRRAYSMANIPDGSGRLEFLIKRKPNGAASTFLFENMNEGDLLAIDGPYGRASLREDGIRNIVLLAGGSGLAPIWSIAQQAVRKWPRRKLHLYFGVNRAKDLFWQEQMERLMRAHHNFCAHVVLMHASPVDAIGFRHGIVADVVATDLADLFSCDLYMAGPPGFIESVMRALVATGRANAERVFFDRFF